MATEQNFASEKDLDEFVEALEKFERGEWGVDQWKAFRLARGIYGQRQQNTQMVRIKIPAGVLSARQLVRIGEVATEASRGFGHLTTRQNIQLHFVDLQKVPAVMEKLHEVGVTTREACGNTVRNVVACPYAGVCADEAFDVTGYAEAVTRHLLRNDICQALPRKFKIAFSGCVWDCANAAIHDIGYIAKVRGANGTVTRGFEMRVGGGLSTSPEDAHKIDEFVPTDELLARSEAVVRVFERLGNRKNKARARLKYVIRTIGFEAFKAEYEMELAALREQGLLKRAIAAPPPDVAPEHRPEHRDDGAGGAPLAEFDEWKRTNVRHQRQAGWSSVIVRLVRGDITTAQCTALAGLSESFGEGAVRLGIDQNAVLRFVANGQLAALHRELMAVGLGRAGAGEITDVTTCPGAETCNLAVTASRELATNLTTALEQPNGNARLVKLGASLKIKISGCPNSCGQHHVAGLGFHGAVKKVDGKAVPYYQLHLGGGVEPGNAVFGRQVVKIPAQRVGTAVMRLLELYDAKRNAGETPLAFFRRVADADVKAAVADLAEVTPANGRPEDFSDLGSEMPFVVAIGKGECAA